MYKMKKSKEQHKSTKKKRQRVRNFIKIAKGQLDQGFPDQKRTAQNLVDNCFENIYFEKKNGEKKAEYNS